MLLVFIQVLKIDLTADLDNSAKLKLNLVYISFKEYDVGTHKNRLIQTVLLSTQNRC